MVLKLAKRKQAFHGGLAQGSLTEPFVLRTSATMKSDGDFDLRNAQRRDLKVDSVIANEEDEEDSLEIRSETPDSLEELEPDVWHALVPQPRRALVRQHDQTVYRAAWYHLLLPRPEQTGFLSSWRNQCKLEWNRSFWQLAQHDETLLEIFMSFAAAKEAAMKGSRSSRDYYLHKGKALTLVSRDVAREGRHLRLPAIAAICLLCMAAFIEGEYGAAQMHLQAIAPLVSAKTLTADVPSFLWLLLAWADLRLTAINSHAPMLPYALHPEFDVQLPPFLRMRATAMAKWNANSLPRSTAFRTEDARALLEMLYAYTEVHSQQYMDWKVAWSVSYQTAFSLAQWSEILEQVGSRREQENYDRVCAFVLAARIFFWFTMSTFVTQGGLHGHLLAQLMGLISNQMPAELCFEWSRYASLDTLLWILFAVYTSVDGVGVELAESKLDWLQASMKMVVKRLRLNSYDEFVARLRRLPFAMAWVNLSCTAYAWLDGSSLVTGFERRSFLPLIRLNFDPMEEIDRLQGHYSLKEIDSIIDDGEPRCTSCREKVMWPSAQLFHFASPSP